MQAYLGDKKLKTRFIAEIKKHEKADALRQGFGYGRETNDGWKGCAVGCSLHSLNIINGVDKPTNIHARFEPELGIPEVLTRLQDRIFEGLPKEESATWPRRFAQAIKPSADLSKVWPKLAVWILIDKKDGVIKFANGRQDVIDAITNVAKAYADTVEGKKLSPARWEALRKAAYAADADAAAYAAADAAYAAAAYAAADDKRKYFSRLSKKLIELLKEAK